MMSETNASVEDNSASKERAAGEAKRSAHGSDQLREFRRWVVQQKREAEQWRVRLTDNMGGYAPNIARELVEAFDMARYDIRDEMSRNNETRCEGTKPNA